MAVSVCPSVCFAADFTMEAHGIATEVNGNEVQLQFYTPSTVRVIKNPVDAKAEKAEPECGVDTSECEIQCPQVGKIYSGQIRFSNRVARHCIGEYFFFDSKRQEVAQ